ncbi:hypothetical protein HDV03_001455 [Kappamyces sp. JEL0829]|nr:hypothetical protein HDV03_001455 [Kappamyces sp. JEL0829]
MTSTLIRTRFPPIYHLSSHIQNAYKAGQKRIAVPYSKINKSITTILWEEGLLQQVIAGDLHGPFELGFEVPITPANIASRRLWLDLKYRNGEPALTRMGVISKPSRRIFASPEECRAIASSRQASALLKGQVLGQVTILDTPYGVVEMKDALRKNVGGEVLCFAS